ncbi:MAG: hypothetical protein IJ684_04795 [Bacteroidales bacterium]|nr:hypothetical protein [Bacteroidales bacterium]
MRRLSHFSIARCISLLMLSCFLPSAVIAQTFRLNKWKYLTDISLDLNRLWDYNGYEGNRWGAGLVFTSPLRYNPSWPRDRQNSLQWSPYVAYGARDHTWKGGFDLALQLPRRAVKRFFVAASSDIEPAGRRQLGSYHLIQTYNNVHYTASRMVGVQRLSLGFQNLQWGLAELGSDFRLSRERYLFDGTRRLYPSDANADAMPWRHLQEWHLRGVWHRRWTADVMAGYWRAADATQRHPYARLLVQYLRTTRWDGAGTLTGYGQAGWCTAATPYSRMFNLGGTLGSLYYFNNSFATVEADRFMASLFAQGCIRYRTDRALWTTRFSNPLPFVQCNAMWGQTKGVAEGETNYSLYDEQVGGYASGLSGVVTLSAPDRGLVEPAIGVERLLRIGMLELGAAVAYRIEPSQAHYHITQPSQRWAFMVAATLSLQYDL